MCICVQLVSDYSELVVRTTYRTFSILAASLSEYIQSLSVSLKAVSSVYSVPFSIITASLSILVPFQYTCSRLNILSPFQYTCSQSQYTQSLSVYLQSASVYSVHFNILAASLSILSPFQYTTVSLSILTVSVRVSIFQCSLHLLGEVTGVGWFVR